MKHQSFDETGKSKASAPSRHIESLDGVRFLAIVPVLLAHAGAPGFAAGWLGVDLFFALSGFLITTLLMQERERVGRIAYGQFMARRALRLMPAYLGYAAFVTWGMWGWAGSVLSTNGAWTPGAYTASLWTYTMNFAPQGGIWNGQIISLHLWSLAVEQQYYLFWPLLVIALGHRPRQLQIAGLMLTLVALAIFIAHGAADLYKAMLFSRGFTLALASTFAVYFHEHRRTAAAWRWQWAAVPGAGCVALAFVLAALGVLTEEQVMVTLLPPISVSFCLWVVWLWYRPLGPGLRSVFLNPVFQYIGKVSYGVYLYHQLVRIAVWEVGKPLMATWPPALGYGTRLVVYLALSVFLAALSYEFLEKGFLRLRTAFRPQASDRAAMPDEQRHRIRRAARRR